MPSAQAIVTHHEADPDRNPYVGPLPVPGPVRVVDPDPTWPTRFAACAEVIRDTLGPLALEVEHVGSTAVPHLAAKDVIDIDLTVADPRREETYVPALEARGYVHAVREPWWHEHRMLRLDDPRVNLHVFGPDCPEVIRHRLLRDWLTTHPTDRARYEAAKRRAADAVASRTVEEYNRSKQPVLREILDRAFAAHGLL